MQRISGKTTLLILIAFIISHQDVAQVKTLRARILDFHSEEPIPFASVQFYRTNYAKLSDSAGNFQFILERWPTDSLLVTYAGFEENYIHLDTSLAIMDLIIKMERKKTPMRLW